MALQASILLTILAINCYFFDRVPRNTNFAKKNFVKISGFSKIVKVYVFRQHFSISTIHKLPLGHVLTFLMHFMNY